MCGLLEYHSFFLLNQITPQDVIIFTLIIIIMKTNLVSSL